MNKLRFGFYWVVVAIMVSSLYMYEEKLTEFGQLFVAHLMPGRTVDNDDGVLEVAEGQGGHFYINTELNGVPVKFMVDTGASTISITQDIAVAAGIDVSKLVFNKVFHTANGVARGASAKIDSLKVGNYEIRDVYVSVSEAGLGTPLLGMSFLGRLQSYTFKGNRLYLRFR